MFIFLDCETSGLDPYIHDITELGVIIIEKLKNKWIVNPKKYFHKRLFLQNPENADDEALEIGHYNEELWQKTAAMAEEGLLEFNDWLKNISPSEKPTMCAHNAEFDKSMILSNCDRFKIFPFMNESWLDSIGVWTLFKSFHNLNHLGNSNKAMCSYFKVENVKAHAALADSAASAQCLSIMLNNISFKEIKT